MAIGLSRRTLLKGGLAVGAGLALGFDLVPRRILSGVPAAPGASAATLFTPSVWLKIDADGIVGIVTHRPTGRQLTYGELADKASQLPVPQSPPLKTPDQFRYIGKDVPRQDIPLKVDGRAVFGIDVMLPGLLVALVERCPVFGGS